MHVQEIGVDKDGDGTKVKKTYGLPAWIKATKAAAEVYGRYDSYLLPMAFTAGSPTHPAYGAGHATVAGVCVTILKAYFQTIDEAGKPIPLVTLLEGDMPYGGEDPIVSYVTGKGEDGWGRFAIDHTVANKLTIEGELNKLAENVAMGRSMGGIHWRTDNTRSLILGEALAAGILFGVAQDTSPGEPVTFRFRTFARKDDGTPKSIAIDKNGIWVDVDPKAPGAVPRKPPVRRPL